MKDWEETRENIVMLLGELSQDSYDENLKLVEKDIQEVLDFIQALLEAERKRTLEEVRKFVVDESGISGRKEIIQFLDKLLTTK